ncbi:DEAD/DEAH box helicase [Bacillus spongiae]|uniref:DEAD/DEAH box helicase n=1 Tax=Bacillus spongiae TaxID=2683610 RepID=A0ABU8HE04_9BACI
MRYYVKNQLLILEPLSKHPYPYQSIASLSIPSPPILNPTFTFNASLQKYLFGKQLLLDELPFPLELLYQHYLEGYVQWEPGLIKKGNFLRCRRCGNQDDTLFGEFQCFRCHHSCKYCRKCIMMGRVSACSALLLWRGNAPTMSVSQVEFNWNGTLSQGQEEASKQIVETIKLGRQLLVWAVCGAGKTEILFEGIRQALSNNRKVCLASPRTDVILELLPRLRQVFPNVNIIGLYGGSEEIFQQSQFILATTHQLFRFYQAFDVMIIDEVDAFPFSYDESLHFAVEKAKKRIGSSVYLTATPTRRWKKTPTFKILARYHGHPLPQPTFHWCGNWKKLLTKRKLPPSIQSWITELLQKEKQALLFFPSVSVMNQALPLFQKLHKKIASVHATDSQRKEKVSKLRNGEIPILLTTTILERGVTISNLNVAVIGAEQTIFTESALIQIAGRVGRDASSPTGDVIFFHNGKSREMEKALIHIVTINRQARKSGALT